MATTSAFYTQNYGDTEGSSNQTLLFQDLGLHNIQVGVRTLHKWRKELQQGEAADPSSERVCMSGPSSGLASWGSVPPRVTIFSNLLEF